MHYVRKFDETAFQTPPAYEAHSQAYGRFSLVDHSVGSVHMGLSICQLEADGMLAPHIHAYEEGFYILQGHLIGRIDDQTYEFRPGDFGVIPMGTTHAWRKAGTGSVRWLEMAAPQPKPAGQERDTFFLKSGVAPTEGAPFNVDQPKGNLLGHFDPGPAPDERQTSVTYLQGVQWQMLVDQALGAQHMTMSFSEYPPRVSLGLHDHAFEESFYVLSGEIEAVLDGERYIVKAGDVFWAGVGCVHAFANVGDTPARWLATQAPQPPNQNAFRFMSEWADRGKALES